MVPGRIDSCQNRTFDLSMTSHRIIASLILFVFCFLAGALLAPPTSATRTPSTTAPGASSKDTGEEAKDSIHAKSAKDTGSAGKAKGGKSGDGSLQEETANAMAATLHTLKAASLAREGKYAEAEKEYLAADKILPDNGPSLQQLSTVQFNLGHPQDALATLERAIRRGTPFDDKAYLLAARVFTRVRAFELGEKKLVEWAADRPISANFHAA